MEPTNPVPQQLLMQYPLAAITIVETPACHAPLLPSRLIKLTGKRHPLQTQPHFSSAYASSLTVLSSNSTSLPRGKTSMSSSSSLNTGSHGSRPLKCFLQGIPGLLSRMLLLRGSVLDRNHVWVKHAVVTSAGLLFGMHMLRVLRKQSKLAGRGPGKGVDPTQTGIVWMRSDLRTSDHEALAAAAMQCSSLVPLYCFDPAEFGKDTSRFERTGPRRARFIIESVEALRQKLRGLGSDLVVRVGRPQQVLPRLAAQTGAEAVYCHSEASTDALQVEARVHAALQQMNVQLKTFWGGSTLFHAEDLPFKQKAIPNNYAHFSQAVENVPVRAPIPTPTLLQGLPASKWINAGMVPTLAQLGYDQELDLTPAMLGTGRLRGGEGEAERHLQAFISDVKSAAEGQQDRVWDSRNCAQARQASCSAALLGECIGGPAFSCRISPWLALGCISPRTVYHEMRCQLGIAASFGEMDDGGNRELSLELGHQHRQQNLGSNWLMFELLWRDFFRLKAATPLQT